MVLWVLVLATKDMWVWGGGKNDFWEYTPATDHTTDLWTEKANVGIDPFSHVPCGFSMGTKGYMCSGADFREYDPVTNAWTPRANFPGPGVSTATGFSVGSKGYIGFGETSEFYKTIFGIPTIWKIPTNKMYEYTPVPYTSITSITAISPTSPSIKAGSSFSVAFTAVGNFNPGNVFTLQIGTPDGNFFSGEVIGSTTTSGTTGTINATIPICSGAGSNYRVRVLSTDPLVGGPDNGFGITIIPIQPKIQCNADIVVNAEAGKCGATVSYDPPVVTDACENTSVAQIDGLASGSFFPVGITTNKFVATSTSGQKDTCSFTVTVLVIPPKIQCNADIVVNAEAGKCGATVSYDAPVVTDACENTSVAQIEGLASGSFFPVGNTTNKFVATSSSGQKDTCSFTVTVLTIPPKIQCNADIVVNSEAGKCGATVSYNPPVVTDACENTTVEQTQGLASGSLFPVGNTTNTFVATSSSGQKDTCSFTVTVLDKEIPVITQVSASPSSLWPPNHQMKDVTINYTASDNCGEVTSTLSVSSNEPANGTGDGDTSPDWIILNDHHVQLRAERSGRGNGRVYTITITSTNASGNTSTQTTQVVVPHNSNGKMDYVDQLFDCKVIPNPSSQYFELQVNSGSNEKIEVNLYDINGKFLSKMNAAKNQALRFGSNLRPGTYMVEVIQGQQHQKIYLIKQ
ncbi:HYR domain-containing protein [Ginsengibacter hankyongi]|uniref:HYR domain-containing protein n=1 Tax=Ginsengibacter hankyongi TaxID=2607284 RepID=A0A5J5ICY6_9BACT|nr:HYR domain-containing protein [Ginsengibacter hankyongi]KAA9037210.1 HYR domain-containing protein [Ginsengibacter hankyongi]